MVASQHIPDELLHNIDQYHLSGVCLWIPQDYKPVRHVESHTCQFFREVASGYGLHDLELGRLIRLLSNHEISSLRVLVFVQDMLEILQRDEVCALGVVGQGEWLFVAVIEGNLV